MTFLPIVERELRVAARLTTTYRNRVIMVGVFAFVAMLIFLFGAAASNPAEVGSFMFWTLSYLVLAFCLLEGVRKTADCLSEEKRDGTLGLLFLTDLKGYDVILGKLAGTSLGSVYGLLSILPLLALPQLLGGVTTGEFWRIALALTNALFFSLCAGMWVSSLSRAEHQAMARTLAVIAIIGGVPFALRSWAYVSPLYAFHGAQDKIYSHATDDYWHSIWVTQAICWAMLLWAWLALPFSWADEKFRDSSARRWRLWQSGQTANRAKRDTLRTNMLRINPAYWLAGRDMSTRILLRVLAALAVAASAVFIVRANLDDVWVFFGVIWAINFIIKVRIAAQACRCLAEARHNGALEMLLVTPLTVEQIIRGQMLALQRMFYLPVIVILGVEFIGLVGGLFTGTIGKQDEGGELVILGAAFMGYLGLVVLDIFAVIWAGMWYGLSAKKQSVAVVKTILFVLVLPLFSGILACYGLPFIIGVPVFWTALGSQNLRREFRRIAARQHLPALQRTSWAATPEQKPLPPVI